MGNGDYDAFMALGLLSDSSPVAPDGQVQEVQRDALSDAHKLQLTVNALYSAQRNTMGRTKESFSSSESLFGNYLASQASAPLLAAQGPALSSAALLGLEEGGELSTLLDLSPPQDTQASVSSDADEDDLFADTSGISRDPSLGIFDQPFAVPPTDPFEGVGGAAMVGLPAPQRGGPDTDALVAGLTDALGPTISSVSRLGGPFGGYTPDTLTQRLREIVRKV